MPLYEMSEYQGRVLSREVTVPGSHPSDPNEFFIHLLDLQHPICAHCGDIVKVEPLRTAHDSIKHTSDNPSEGQLSMYALVYCALCKKHFFISCTFNCRYSPVYSGSNIERYSLAEVKGPIAIQSYPTVMAFDTEKSKYWKSCGIDEHLIFLYEQACQALDGGSHIFGGGAMRTVLEKICLILTNMSSSKDIGLAKLMEKAGIESEKIPKFIKEYGDHLLHSNEEISTFTMEDAKMMRRSIENLIENKIVVPREIDKVKSRSKDGGN